jgi:hypothetical protein
LPGPQLFPLRSILFETQVLLLRLPFSKCFAAVGSIFGGIGGFWAVFAFWIIVLGCILFLFVTGAGWGSAPGVFWRSGRLLFLLLRDLSTDKIKYWLYY